jgi:transcriptional regulator with XRE-family HTH domain
MKSLFAQRLRAARQAIHPPVTQREVARKFDLSPSAVNLWEAGKTEPSVQDIIALSRWYEVSTDWLLGLSDGKPVSAANRPPLNYVPVVAPSALARWKLDAVIELLQTGVAYPPNTAAGMLVSSDALSSTCPTGCYVVISKGHQVTPGQAVLAVVGRVSDPVIRKYIREGGDDLLVADDTRFPTHKMSDGVRIIGRVVEVTVRKIL